MRQIQFKTYAHFEAELKCKQIVIVKWRRNDGET